MSATARFDLKMDVEEKEIFSRAAAIMGTTTAAFIRIAAKEKAQELLDRDAQVTMTARDFSTFIRAFNGSFVPNAVLEKAIKAAQDIKKHA